MQTLYPIKIRPLNSSDTWDAQQLVLKIQREEFGVQIDIADQPDLADFEHFGACGKFWGAFAGEELVGTISIIMFYGEAAAIRKMFVKEPFRGNGYNIALLLLKELTGYAVGKDIATLYLGTIEMLQAAVKFYIKNGFVQVDKAALPEGFPRMESDNLFFKKDIL